MLTLQSTSSNIDSACAARQVSSKLVCWTRVPQTFVNVSDLPILKDFLFFFLVVALNATQKRTMSSMTRMCLFRLRIIFANFWWSFPGQPKIRPFGIFDQNRKHQTNFWMAKIETIKVSMYSITAPTESNQPTNQLLMKDEYFSVSVASWRREVNLHLFDRLSKRKELGNIWYKIQTGNKY